MHKIVLPFLWLVVWSAGAQTPAGERKFAYGALIGMETQMLGGSYTKLIDQANYAVAGHGRAGASFGVFGQWALSRSIALRPQLLLSFNQNDLRLFSGYDQIGTVRYRFTDLEIPLHFVATNQVGKLPVRASVLAGGRISWNFASDPSNPVIGLYHERFAIDIGLGAEFQCNRLKIKPEVVYSYGVNNIHNVSDLAYDWSIGRVVRDRLTLRVLFWMVDEGR
jgi:hypothetical protein